MKPMLFFDVDDTLLDSRTHTISERTRKALQQMQQEYPLGIATGRSFSTLLDVGIVHAAPWSYFVCNNGQLVYDENYHEIYRHTMDDDIVKQIIQTAAMRNEPLLAATPQWLQIHTANAYQEEAHHFFHMAIPTDCYQEGQDVFMMVAFGPKGCAYDAYRAIEGIMLLPSQSTYCDIIAKDSGKHVGIQAALQHCHCPSFVAFGDSDNDIDMLKHAQYGIAMGQGSTQAKAHADFITKAVYEDGIAYAWEHAPYFRQNKKQ